MFKLDNIGGTIFHTRRLWNNAWTRYINYECCPYDECFSNEKWGDIEIWQTPCGEVVFEFPGFYHKFDAGYFHEHGWNTVNLQIHSAYDDNNYISDTFSVRCQVMLNEEVFDAPIEGNWVPSVYRLDYTTDSASMEAFV